jgi:hypothetical protein
MRSIISTTSSLPPIEPPEDFLDKLNTRLDKEIEQESKLTRFVRRSRPYIGRYGAVAACFAVAVTVGINADTLVSRMNNSDDGVISRTTTSDDGIAVPELPEDIKADKSGEESDTASEATTVPSIVPTFGDMSEAQTRDKSTSIPMGAVGSDTQQAKAAQPQKTETVKNSSSVNTAGTSASAANAGMSVGAGSTASATPVPQLSTVAPSASYNSGSASAAVQEEAQKDNSPSVTSAASSEDNITADTAVEKKENADISPAYVRARIAEGPDEYSVVDNLQIKDEYAEVQSLEESDTVNALSDYTIVQMDTQEEMAYSTPLGSTISIKSKDADRAKEVIDVFVSGVYGNYYMITSGDMNDLLSQLGREGIWYDANINESGDKISFKLIIY